MAIHSTIVFTCNDKSNSLSSFIDIQSNEKLLRIIEILAKIMGTFFFINLIRQKTNLLEKNINYSILVEKINNLLFKNSESHQSEHQVQFLSTSQMQILLGQHKLSHRNSCMGEPTLIHQLQPSLGVEFRLCLNRVSNRKLNFCRSHHLLNF